MKGKPFRFIAVFLILVLLGLFGIGILFPTLQFKYSIDIYAPLYKAYGDIASHELKTKLYSGINPTESHFDTFEAGHISTICFDQNKKQKCIQEEVIELDSLKLLKAKYINPKTNIISTIQFVDKDKVTGLQVHEIIQGSNYLENAMMQIFQVAIRKNRENWYEKIKISVESTPDYKLMPEEIK